MRGSLSPEAYKLMCDLWVAQKRWVRGRGYRDPGYVMKAFDVYTQRVRCIIEDLEDGKYDISWTYRKISGPVTVPWGRQTISYYGQVSIGTSYGVISFLDSNPERVVENAMNFWAPLVEDPKKQSETLLKFFQALGQVDLTSRTLGQVNAWDIINDAY